MDHINLERGKQLTVLINSYKLFIYDVDPNSITEDATKKATSIGKENFSLKPFSSDLLQKLKSEMNDKNQKNFERPKDKEPNHKENNIKSYKDKFDQKELQTQILEKTKGNQEKTKDGHKKSPIPTKDIMQHFNIKINPIPSLNISDDDDDYDLIDRCLQDFYSNENPKNEPEANQEIKENSCFDYFGYHFDIPDLLTEKPSRFSAQNSTSKKGKADSPRNESIDKKKRRMNGFGEEEEEFKNFNLKKKKFKFDSPLFSRGSSAKVKKPEMEPLKQEDKENKEQEENDMMKKFIRLKKIKDIQDENTCSICLGILEIY